MSQSGGNLIGITGHQSLAPATRKLIAISIREVLRGRSELTGVSSLAAGADQIFAQAVLEVGGKIIAVLPSSHYERSFGTSADLAEFRRLLGQVERVETMPFDQPSEVAYLLAGQKIVDYVDLVVAVWDGSSAGGLGGTADIVRYARGKAKPVTVIWPEGASRG